MPVISFDYEDLIELMGVEVSRERLVETIPMMGAEVEKAEEYEFEVEFFPNRPDLYSVEGVARALNTFMGHKKGLSTYEVKDSGLVLNVDPSVNEVRPYIVSGLVTGVKMTNAFIQSLMNVQEKLHATLGRGRQKVAIGVHDYERIEGPFTYKAVDPESITFVPLAKEEEMDLAEILRKHEKGIDYAHLMQPYGRYPIIVDKNHEVLSFPPIINGSLTTVTDDTTDLFLDLTGWHMGAVTTALNIIACMLADRGGELHSVKVVYPDKTIVTPDLDPTVMEVEPKSINSIIGLDLPAAKICGLLEKMGFGAEPKGENIAVSIPPYRSDVLHPVDLAEDVAIAYGYMDFEEELPKAMTFGKLRAVDNLCQSVRQTLVGLNFNEVYTLSLTNDKVAFQSMLRKEQTRTIIQNPISEEYTCIRTDLVPSLMQILKVNKHRDLPQRIFEIGDAVVDERNVRLVAGATIHPKASFTDTKSLMESILQNLGVKYEIEAGSQEYYITGRQAKVAVNGEDAGSFGEVHPKVITNFELLYPVATFELNISKLFDSKR